MKPIRFSACCFAFILVAIGSVARGQSAVPDVAIPPVTGPLSLVNVMQGTDSTRDFSHGNTLPLISAPWSMTDWCLQNRPDINERWYYHFKGTKFYGFRATHEPCPWAGDYGHFTVCPQVGQLAMAAADRACIYDPAKTIMRPDYAQVRLNKIHVTAELTASERCGVMRFHFEPADKTGRLIFQFPGDAQLQVQGNRVFGYSKYHTGPCEGDYHNYFEAELDRPITGSGLIGTAAAVGKGSGYIEFPIDRPVVEIKIGTSSISPEQAKHTLEIETRGGFDGVRQRTAAAWVEHLGKITIDATPDQQATFYTCMFRAMKFPHKLYELDPAGKPVHFSPWDGKVHSGVAYTDSGLWDTYRTQYPFFTLVYPDQMTEIINGWLNAYREGGWLPQWPNPGGFRGMTGSHADAMVVDAMSKGLKGFDYNTAYEALHHDAFDIPQKSSHPGGREGMRNYLKFGYLPSRTATYWVSSSLDYAYDDWCVAQAAKLTHHPDDFDLLMKRSMNYRKLWDPAVKFMRGKEADGTWAEPNDWDEFAWGDGYTESGPWQSSWAVQHDVAGMADLLGGPREFGDMLDHLFHQPSVFHTGGYGGVIHEMSEFAACNMGQFAPNNQPSFHLPYLYAAVGQPWKTEYWTRRACTELFNAGPDGFCGDDDNGSSASWYLLSSMGFYSLTPGEPQYVLTSPLFKSVKISLPGNKTFTITAPDNSATNVYVKARTLNGQANTNTWITHGQITAGGTMTVQMTDKPTERVVTEKELPYSAKTEMSGAK